MIITVAARTSPLSRVQVQEVLSEIRTHFSDIEFDVTYLKTTGDIDLKTPLIDVEKSDFFTQEIDLLQLEGKARLSIHSAKDLPDHLQKGLKIICITEGVDPRDALVMPDGHSLSSLPINPRIGSCSLRRRIALEELRSDVVHVDIRGPIHERLQLLQENKVCALVVAEAALIRLKLTHLNRIYLDTPPAPLQGQLALIAREDDKELEDLFSCIDSRRRQKDK